MLTASALSEFVGFVYLAEAAHRTQASGESAIILRVKRLKIVMTGRFSYVLNAAWRQPVACENPRGCCLAGE